jgi:predicted dehydrogenase
MEQIKIGMIGYNDGNGHPYSFSAIINGYNELAFKDCPYPVINSYLKDRAPEDFGVRNLVVSHVWTPFRHISESIASYANVKNISHNYVDMIGEVDGVIIARDDAETHREIAKPFLDAGLRVFVDKPLCKTKDDLDFFESFVRKGQVMSCSGLRFFPAILSNFDGQLLRDRVAFFHCVAPLDWFKYGIHVLESVSAIVDSEITSVHNIGEENNEIVRFEFENGSFALIQVLNTVGGGLRSSVYRTEGQPFHIHFNDNFSCFRQQLIHFHDFLNGRIIVPPTQTINLMKAMMAAVESRLAEKKIFIKS